MSTYPGNRLPHAWLDSSSSVKLVSTHDLAGKGRFCLLIGVHGSAWRVATDSIARDFGIPIVCYGIGYGQEYTDIRRDWSKKCGVGESGCVLVRPDRFVVWRSFKQPNDCNRKLRHVIDTVLCRVASD